MSQIVNVPMYDMRWFLLNGIFLVTPPVDHQKFGTVIEGIPSNFQHRIDINFNAPVKYCSEKQDKQLHSFIHSFSLGV